MFANIFLMNTVFQGPHHFEKGLGLGRVDLQVEIPEAHEHNPYVVHDRCELLEAGESEAQVRIICVQAKMVSGPLWAQLSLNRSTE